MQWVKDSQERCGDLLQADCELSDVAGVVSGVMRGAAVETCSVVEAGVLWCPVCPVACWLCSGLQHRTGGAQWGCLDTLWALCMDGCVCSLAAVVCSEAHGTRAQVWACASWLWACGCWDACCLVCSSAELGSRVGQREPAALGWGGTAVPTSTPLSGSGLVPLHAAVGSSLVDAKCGCGPGMSSVQLSS